MLFLHWTDVGILYYFMLFICFVFTLSDAQILLPLLCSPPNLLISVVNFGNHVVFLLNYVLSSCFLWLIHSIVYLYLPISVLAWLIDWFFLNLIHISSLIPHSQSAQCDHHSYQLGFLISTLFPPVKWVMLPLLILMVFIIKLMLTCHIFIYLFLITLYSFSDAQILRHSPCSPLNLFIPSVKFGFCDFSCHSIIWKVYAFVN